MKKNINLFIATLLTLLMSSCMGDSKNEMTETRRVLQANNFTVVYDRQTDTQSVIGNGASYEFKYELYSRTATVTVNGLQLSAGGGAYAFTLPAIPYSNDKFGSPFLNCTEMTDHSNNVTVSNLKVYLVERLINGFDIPYYAVSYTINNRYDVRMVQRSIYYFGDTSVRVANGQPTTDNTPFYALNFDPRTLTDDGTVNARLYIFQARFATGMPLMDMVIGDVPVKFTTNGFTMNAESLKIYTNETQEQPDYAISNLQGNSTFPITTNQSGYNNCFDLKFTVAGRIFLESQLGISMPQ